MHPPLVNWTFWEQVSIHDQGRRRDMLHLLRSKPTKRSTARQSARGGEPVEVPLRLVMAAVLLGTLVGAVIAPEDDAAARDDSLLSQTTADSPVARDEAAEAYLAR